MAMMDHGLDNVQTFQTDLGEVGEINGFSIPVTNPGLLNVQETREMERMTRVWEVNDNGLLSKCVLTIPSDDERNAKGMDTLSSGEAELDATNLQESRETSKETRKKTRKKPPIQATR
jgi:hypothetical protein